PGACYPNGNALCDATGAFSGTWKLYGAQSLNLRNSNGTPNASPSWEVTQVTADPMHMGDICNLGIACPPTANRNLADFIMETVDPDGCAHIAFADDQTTNEVDAANQV